MNLRRKFETLFLAGVAAVCALSGDLGAATPVKTFPSAVKRNLDEEARLIVNLLQNYHYSGRAFRDIENKEMIVRFLSELDPERYFLSESDIEQIVRRFDRTLKAVYIYKGDMQPAQEIYGNFTERMRKRLDWVERRLGTPFDLDTDSVIGPADLDPGKDAAAEDRRWELRLTNEVIRVMLAGRDETAARAHVARHYRRVRAYVEGLDAYEVRAMFLDSTIRSFDPRSGYFSADSTREFELELEGTVTGVGLDVSKEDGRCIVARVHPGGPADLDSPIQPGFEIVAIADDDAEATQIANMRLREVTGMLRGKPDTRVTLRYRAEASAPEAETTLTRSKVTLIQNRASGTLHRVPGPDGTMRRIGVIVFPSFYGGSETEGSSVSADVAELIALLRERGIEGLVIDIRDNPGGAVQEANKLCGLFLAAGTTIHARPQAGEGATYQVTPAPNRYDGPLIVLTSPESASASELFAGAMQFHERAIVIGGAATYGKGSVQHFLRLGATKGAAEQRDWGTLRLTSAVFHLPDGRAVQRTGVASDIVLPLEPSPAVKRESELEHSLPATDLASVTAERAPGPPRIGRESALALSLRRIAADNLQTLPEWQLWADEERHYAPLDEMVPQSLNIATRRAEWESWSRAAVELADRRRGLVDASRHAAEPVDIAETAEAIRRHDDRLRVLLAGAEPAPIARIAGGGLIVGTDAGRLRRLRWTTFPYHRYTGFAGDLADAFNAGAGTHLERDEFALILSELRLEEHPNDTVVRETFARHLPEGTPQESIQSGVEAMVQRAVELDPNQRADRAVFDIPLREAARIAAEWARFEAGEGAPAVEAP
jgi:carboxyl-terminal processing protease